MMDAVSEGVHASLEAAQGAEERVRAIMEAAPVPMVVTRASDGVVLYASWRLGPTFGVSPDDVVGRPAADFYIDGPSHEELLALLRESGGYIRDLDVSARKVDGTPAWVIASIQEMEYGGEPALLTGIHDVTARKHMQDALRASEERYRTIVESVEEVIYVVSLADDPFHGSIQFVSPPTKEILGYEPEDFLRDPDLWFRIVHPEDRESVIDSTRKILASGSPGTRVYRVQHKETGAFVWLEDHVTPQAYEGGKVTVFRGVARDITQRKRAEEALRESEEKYRRLVQDSIDGIAIAEGAEIRFVNSALLNMFGCQSEEEMVGRPAAAFLPPEYRDVLLERNHAREQGQPAPTHYEFKALRKDGSMFDAEASIGRVSYQGRTATQAVVRDITQRKQTEEALRESEGQFRLVTDAVPVLISYVDAEQRYRFNNKAYHEWFGHSQAEAYGRYVKDVLGDSAYEAIRGHIELALSGQRVTFEDSVPYRHGGVRHVRAIYVPDVSEDEGIRGFVALVIDITERKRAEKALRQSEERYRDLAENLNDAIFEFDTSGRMTYVSSGMQRVSGYSPSEILNRPFTQLVHPEDLQALADRIRGRPFGDRTPSEYRLLRKSGEARWVQSLGQAIFEGDRVVGFRGALTDITERKEMEAGLERIRETLDSTTERQMRRGNLHGLTFREMTVLNLITEGKADKEIATILGISFLTARKHTANILSKMGAASRTQAAVEAVRQGLLN